MKIWRFLLFVSLITIQGLLANNSSFTLDGSIQSITCGVPDPPNDLNTEAVGINWADLTWTPVSGADQYVIKTYNAITNVEVSSTTVSGTANNTRITWPDFVDDPVYANIRCVTGGVVGRKSNDKPVGAVILELVVFGNNFNGNGNACPLSPVEGDGCNSFWWGSSIYTSYIVSRKNAEALVKAKFVSQGFTEFIAPNLILHHIQIGFESSQWFSIAQAGNGNFEILDKNTGQLVTRLSGVHVGTSPSTEFGRLYLESPNNDYAVKKYGMTSSGRPALSPDHIAIRNNDFDSSTSDLKTIPNPFNDILTLELPDTDNQAAANVHLYDLLGAVKISFAAPADQRTITFDTADLTPGVYFLRVETGGQIETIKVVKTQ